MNFIEELQWRGMLHDMTPGTAEQLAKETTTAYIGLTLRPTRCTSVAWLRYFCFVGFNWPAINLWRW